MFNLLCRKLSLLDAQPAAATRAGGLQFRLKLLHAAGLAPQLGACAHCGEPEHLVGFSGAAGGVVCGACEAGSFPLGEDAHGFMARRSARALAETPDGPEQRARAGRARDLRDARAPRPPAAEASGGARGLTHRRGGAGVCRPSRGPAGIVAPVDEGLPIAYQLLDAGVPVLASDGTPVGTVMSVLAAPEKDVFHGLLIKTTGRGVRFVEAADRVDPRTRRGPAHRHGRGHGPPRAGARRRRSTTRTRRPAGAGTTGSTASPGAATGTASAERGRSRR